ncbi:chimeric ERCC6-PGBD3 protein-like [Carassius auratus]|uniref:Chimeric ERCC6-PGBD3 protein-like n=1 Tax=Carassius auratus TaxID=7957 RepID=A0A6P6RMA0_CARAU|nr:chimeric ERCC6-PGBD3 protein-like [Carassius auratus]
MASTEDVGAKKQMFYEIECVIDDCDTEVGYKPLSDSDELDDSAEEDEEPREEEIDSSEEWEPLRRSKLKRSSSSSPSSSLPRRRGRPRKNASTTSPSAPAMAHNPKTTSALSLPRRRGRPPKDKSKAKLFSKPSPYPAIVPKPPLYGTLIPNSSIKFSPHSTSTFTLGSNFTPITLTNASSSVKLNPNSTPILISNPASTFKLSPDSTAASHQAPIATLFCTPTSTGLVFDGNTNKIPTVKKEEPWEENVDAIEEWPITKKEILEHSESPNAKRQRLSSPIPQSTTPLCTDGPLKHSSKTTPSPLPELAPIASSDHVSTSQPTSETIDEPLTTLFASDSNPNSEPIRPWADSDLNSDLDGDGDGDSDEISDSGREEELWEEDPDSADDWNPLLESPDGSKSPASAQSPSSGNPTTPTSSGPINQLSKSTSEPASKATPTFEATTNPAPEATPTTNHNSISAPIPSPAPTVPRKRGRPRKHPLKPNVILKPTPDPAPAPTTLPSSLPAADSTPVPADPIPASSLDPSPNPTISINSEPNPEPASTSEAMLQPASTKEKPKLVATPYSPNQTTDKSLSALDLPWTKVDGKTDKWLDTTNEDEEPLLPNYSPKQPPGPQLTMDATYTPLELFQLFFTKSAVKTIVRNTNSNAEKKVKAGKKFVWLPLTVAEFYSYLALVVYMGLVKVKSIADYWTRKRIYNFSYPSSIMSRARFQVISWNLLLCDPKEDEKNNKKKGTMGYDRLFRIKPLYTDILSACRKHFHPNREILVDERMVATKARLGLKKYMKDKPTKLGYKLFVLADASCGYTWNFYVYEGKTSTSSGKGAGYDSVKRLLDHKVLGKGYRLYMDNFYTSPTLFLDLLQNGILACGMLRHASSLPKANDLSGRSELGSIRWCRQGPLLFVKWMDAREVLMCSSIHKAFTGDTVTRNTKDSDGVWRKRQIPVPSAVKDYSEYMGGIDLSDSLIEHYNILHKTIKWYKTFFFHFLDIAVGNSFILHQELAKAQKKVPLNYKLFKETLVSELACAGRSKNPSAAKDPSTSATPVSRRVPTTHTETNETLSDTESSPPASPAQTEQCYPEYFGSDATHGRRVCHLCKLQGNKVKTPIYCSHCKVALCFVSTRNCFKKWHMDYYLEDL